MAKYPINNWFEDLGKTKTKIAQRVYWNYAQVESFYILPEDIDHENKTYYVSIGSGWMFGCDRPSKSDFEWFKKWIYRKYGYTCIDAI